MFSPCFLLVFRPRKMTVYVEKKGNANSMNIQRYLIIYPTLSHHLSNVTSSFIQRYLNKYFS